jgi:hypothetical protein
MRWIICRRCDKSVPPERVQGHLKKQKIYCSYETLKSIVTECRLMLLDLITAWKKDTVALQKAIGGILTRKDHKCVECGHCTVLLYRGVLPCLGDTQCIKVGQDKR